MNAHTYFVLILLLAPQWAFSQEPYFQDIAPEAGLQGSTDLVQYGIAWGDFDGDGDDDCFVATHPGNQLFRNEGNGKFSDVSQSAGIADPEFGASGGAWGDYDGDGDLDLIVTNLSAEEEEEHAEGEEHSDIVPNRLYRNDGAGTFTDVAETAGVSGLVQDVTGGSTGASWVDYDNDGHLDVLVCNRFRGALLYRNAGDGTFVFASHETGFSHSHEEEHEEDAEEHEHELTSVEHAAWGDYDGDGDLDVFFSVALAAEEHHHHDGESEEEEEEEEGEEHHTETANAFFRNNGDGTFSEVTEEAGLHQTNGAVSHTSVWGDYDNDGDLDLFVGNLGSVNEQTAIPSQLFRNNGNGTFTDVSESVGIQNDYYTFNAAWVDANNDGLLDLSIIYHPSHDDFPAGILYQYPHPLYLANGDGTFTNINATVEDALLVTGMVDISHLIGLAWNDADGDGAMDAVFTENHGDGPIRLYRNESLAAGNHWLSVNLNGSTHNTKGVGATVYLISGGKTQMQIVGAGMGGWGSSSPLRVHFGLGSETQATVKVRWPDGPIESYGTIDANQNVTLVQGKGQNETDISNWPMY